MASVKVYLKTSKVFASGASPIIIEVIHRRKQYTKQLAKIFPEYWDERKGEVRSSHLYAIKLNQVILYNLQDVKTYLLDCQARGMEPDPTRFFNRQSTDLTLNEALINKADRMRERSQFRSSSKYISTANKVTDVGLNINIGAVTVRSLEDFQSKVMRTGASANTVSKHLECIRTVLSELKKEGVIDRSPFESFQIKRVKSHKAKLNEKEFALWMNSEPVNPRHILARDIFTCATMLRGMRAHDILTLRPHQIKDGRLSYMAQKTGKLYDMRIPDACMSILDRYLSTNDEYVFPLMDMPYSMYKSHKREFEVRVNAKNTYVNKYTKELAILIGLSKRVTMHIARHTFGYLADRRGVGVTAIQNLYGHSSLGMTERYIQELRESDELDKAVDGLF